MTNFNGMATFRNRLTHIELNDVVPGRSTNNDGNANGPEFQTERNNPYRYLDCYLDPNLDELDDRVTLNAAVGWATHVVYFRISDQ